MSPDDTKCLAEANVDILYIIAIIYWTNYTDFYLVFGTKQSLQAMKLNASLTKIKDLCPAEIDQLKVAEKIAYLAYNLILKWTASQSWVKLILTNEMLPAQKF